MKHKLHFSVVLWLLTVFMTVNLFAQGTAFTYQGNLSAEGSPANGSFDLTFTLYSTNSGGTVVAGPITNTATFVTNGLFNVSLDFGSDIFNGNPRWLEIGVQTNSGTNFITLSPRQLLTAIPYSILAGDVANPNIARINATNATQTATAVPVVTSGFITSVNVTSGGEGYTTEPTVTASDTTGSGAVLWANIANGQIVSITVSNAGGGYSSGATIVISAPSGASYQTFNGINNFNNPSNYFSGNGSGLVNLNPSSLNNGTITSTLNFTAPSNTFTGAFTGNGGGLTNLNAATFNGLSPNAFWTTNGTTGANPTNGAYLGTADNLPLEIHVNSTRALRLEPTSASPNIIGGYYGNLSGSNVYGATVAGGGAANYPNIASANLASVLGGGGNIASGLGASATGINNRATNGCALAAGTNSLAGGIAALAIGNAAVALGNYSSALGGSTKAAGAYSEASGTNTFAGGTAANAWGLTTSASGDYSTAWGNGSRATNTQATAFGYYALAGGTNAVSMGFGTIATGDYSFAGGYDAQSTNTGAFVWADSTSANPVGSATPYSVTIRASGGYHFFSNPTLTAGVSLASNATSWATISDVHAKKNFAPINGEEILQKLASIPVEKWNYKWESDDSTPNIGPMAQDFVSAFYPGRDDKHITTLEFDGVELAAIQGLNQKLTNELNVKEQEIDALKTQNDALEKRLDRLEKTIEQPK